MTSSRETEDSIGTEVTETVEYFRHRTVRRHREELEASQRMTPWADSVLIVTEHRLEEATDKANLIIKVTDKPVAEPTEQAELNISLLEGEGNIRVPSRYTGKLLDGCIVVGCAVSTGLTAKWVMEAPNHSLQDWMVLTVVIAHIIGIGALAWRAMRRRQR